MEGLPKKIKCVICKTLFYPSHGNQIRCLNCYYKKRTKRKPKYIVEVVTWKDAGIKSIKEYWANLDKR